MRKSAKELKEYLEKEYINSPTMGSSNISTAIRDLLTDLLHLGDIEGIDIDERFSSAEKVYQEEKDEDS